MQAPLAAIDAIETGTRLPFSEGCEVEKKLYLDCLFSDQSKALIHLFFAERAAKKSGKAGAPGRGALELAGTRMWNREFRKT